MVSEPPSSDDFLSEPKLDGFRMSVSVDAGRARLVSRHGKVWSNNFPTICEAALRLPLKAALLDGELTVLLPSGLTSFQALQNRSSLPPGAALVFHAFEILHLDGQDVGRRPLEERKALLEQLLAPEADRGVVRYLPHIIGDGPRVLKSACALGMEGIVSKRRSALHVPGRSRAWLKCKCVCAEPFVLGGFTASGDSLGSLLVGQYDEAGALRYASAVGTGKGFTRAFLRELRAQLGPYETPLSPFVDFSPASVRSPWGKRQAVPTHWVQPVLVADIAFLERTHTGLRHASFQRFRTDLNPLSVSYTRRP